MFFVLFTAVLSVSAIGCSADLGSGDDQGCSVLVTSNEPFDPRNITFFLFTGPVTSPNEGKQIYAGDAKGLYDAGFNKSCRTEIYVHGFGSGYKKPLSFTIATAIFNYTNQCVNLIYVDYSPYSPKYFFIYKYRYEIAAEMSNLVDFLLLSNLASPYDLRLVGHSFGAQLLSYIVRGVRAPDSRKIRVLGLDPAGPCFYNFDDRTNRNVADTVICIFTSIGLGIHSADCTYNFFANGGSSQPPCLTPQGLKTVPCDHISAVLMYADSIVNEAKYPADRCPNELSASLLPFGADLTCKSDGTYMGAEVMSASAPVDLSYNVKIPDSFIVCENFSCLDKSFD